MTLIQRPEAVIILLFILDPRATKQNSTADLLTSSFDLILSLSASYKDLQRTLTYRHRLVKGSVLPKPDVSA